MRPSRSLRRARRCAPSLSSSRFHPRSLSLLLPLDIVPPLFPRVSSLFFIPAVPSRSLVHVHPVPYSLDLLSRSSLVVPPLVSIPVRIGASSALLASLFLFRSLSFRSAVHNHPPAARSVLVGSATARRRVHLRTLFARTLHPFRRSISVTIRFGTVLSIFLSSSLAISFSFFSRPLFLSLPIISFSDQCFFARRLCIVGCLVRGTYIIQAHVCVRVHPGHPSRAHPALRENARVRIASIRVHGEKKMGGCIVDACHCGV